jgi:2-keto-4-pentenoate hydratase/2-oxohepta-3-ene-1,7-dioic acid hydratase in catechol pathway
MKMLTMDMDKVICVGKNYLKHAIELGDAVPEEPLYFLKPPSVIYSALDQGAMVDLASQGDIHHEAELVFEIRRMGTSWKLSRYTIGLDLTRRDLQNHLKKAGQPWEKAKVFKNSCILGPWRELVSMEKLMSAPFSLTINGSLRQQAHGAEMRWTPEYLIQDVSRWFPICDGDVLFTGTPEGVGPLRSGDQLLVSGLDLRYELSIA